MKNKLLILSLISLTMSLSLPAFAKYEKFGDRTKVIAGKKYSLEDLSQQAYMAFEARDYKKAIKFFKELGPFIDEEDNVTYAYVLYLAGDLDNSRGQYDMLVRTSKNKKVITDSQDMLKVIDKDKKTAIVGKLYNKSMKNCQKKHCYWLTYYRNGKIKNTTQPPDKDSKDIWRVESVYKGANVVNLQNVTIIGFAGQAQETVDVKSRWFWFEKAWVNSEYISAPYNKEYIDQYKEEHKEVFILLNKLKTKMNISALESIVSASNEIALKTKDSAKKKMLLEQNKSLTEQIKNMYEMLKNSDIEPYYTIEDLKQAKIELMNLNTAYNSKIIISSSYNDNVSLISNETEIFLETKQEIFNKEKKLLAQAIKELEKISLKY